jgi:hypothetical protein
MLLSVKAVVLLAVLIVFLSVDLILYYRAKAKKWKGFYLEAMNSLKVKQEKIKELKLKIAVLEKERTEKPSTGRFFLRKAA